MQMYTSLHKQVLWNRRAEVLVDTVFSFGENSFQKETSWCPGNKGSGNTAGNEQGHSEDTNSVNQDRLSKGKSKDSQLRAPEWGRMSFDPNQTQNLHIYKSM